MAASLTTNTKFNQTAYQEEIISFVSDDSGDWVVLDAPGIVAQQVTGPTGAELANTYGTLAVLNAGTAYTATSTSIVYDTGTPNSMTRKAGAYYLLTSSGEIMFVVADSGYTADTGTLTVRRGVLGTDASATGVANGNTLYVLNCIVTGADVNGRVFIKGMTLPTEPGVNLF